MNQHRPIVRWTGVCVDCSDADELGEFYSQLLGWEVTATDDHGWVQLRDPSGGVGLNIQAEDWYRPPTWPEEADAAAKMMHFEIEVDDLETAIELAVASGGEPAPFQPEERDQSRIRVMLDPAGHPFCLFVRGD